MHHQYPSFRDAKGTKVTGKVGSGGEGRCVHMGDIAIVAAAGTRFPGWAGVSLRQQLVAGF